MNQRVCELECHKLLIRRNVPTAWTQPTRVIHCVPVVQAAVISKVGPVVTVNGLRAKVGVVESEKTAVIASIYFPEMAWVSVGSESLLTAYDGSCSILKPLRGREVVLFPDLGAEDSWAAKMMTLRKHGIDCSISSLRAIASEDDFASGYDLADYLLRWSVDEFLQK